MSETKEKGMDERDWLFSSVIGVSLISFGVYLVYIAYKTYTKK